MHVLLADDHPQVRSALRLLLEQEPEIQNVDEVTDARNLLTRVQTTHPDLVLLDWELPGLSTINLLSGLRECCPGLLVIALSVRLEARRIALATGADAFVSKGDSPEYLLTILQKIKNGGSDKMKQELIKDWMTREVISIAPDTPLPEAHRLMTEKQIRRLPVIKEGRLIGIVTRGDVREAEPSDATSLSIWEVNYLLSKLKIEKIMTRDVVTIDQEATIGEAAKLMMEQKISGLPVVDNKGNLVGIITESDIFRTVVKRWSTVENLAV